ncbi:MAG: Lrp/AsnC family transcriptional regulator [Candidatus Thorarchaeota archaeon]
MIPAPEQQKPRSEEEGGTKLTGQYLSLLIAIQENPFGRLIDLARSTGMSKPTVAKRIRELQGENGGKRYFAIMPLLNYGRMGLTPIDVLLSTPNLAALETLEAVARHHPYSAYRGRCFGSTNGLLMQFRVPEGTEGHLHSLVERLKENGIVDSAKFLSTNSNSTTHTSFRLSGWDPNSMTWDFNWHEWFARMSEVQPNTRGRETEVPSVLRWLTRRDVLIINELMKGSRRKHSEIIASLKTRGVSITPKVFSQRMFMIRNECIDGFRVTFDADAFDINTNLIIFGKSDRAYLQSLASNLKTNPIPFESTLRISDTELFWFIRLQPTHLSSVLTNLYASLSEMRVGLIDYNHSYVFHLWEETFDPASRTWIGRPDFMVEQVLERSGIDCHGTNQVRAPQIRRLAQNQCPQKEN